jgi:hypothetical protein
MATGRILYIGPMWEGGTCRERARTLEGYGYALDALDTAPYLEQTSRVVRAFEHRLLWGPNVIALNKAFEKLSKVHPRPDVIWIDKARWLFPAILEKIKKETGAICIHYTPDPAFTVHTSRHFAKAIPLFDLCVTTKGYELNAYRDRGAKDVLFTLQGIDDRFTSLAQPPNSLSQSGSVFVGHCEPHYINVLNAAASVDDDLQIYGPGWTKAGRGNPILSSHVKAEGAWGDDYVRVLALAKIGLGLLCKNYPDQFTTRSFEVPAAGAMLLAERTEAHQELFVEGVEAEYFSTIDEMKEKLKFYLANESARLGIAAAGQARCLDEYHWKKVLLPAVEWIESLRT